MNPKVAKELLCQQCRHLVVDHDRWGCAYTDPSIYPQCQCTLDQRQAKESNDA